MRKVLCLTLTLVMCLFSQAVFAADNYTVVVDGKVVTGYELKWNESGDRIFIGADFFEACLGAGVETDGDVTTVSKDGNEASFKLGDKYFVMNGIGSRTLDTANFAEGTTAYIPLRFMCEALGAAVVWDGAARTASVTTGAAAMPEDVKPYLEDVEVYDQSSIRITGAKTVYIDPVKIVGTPRDADVILITHTHGDHYDINSIKNVMNENTVLYVTADGLERAEENGLTNVKSVVPGAEYSEAGIAIKTVPAYNTSSDRQNHKKESNWVGYIVTVDSVTYYSAGDTDYLPDMDNIDADVAFFPIDGRYNMEKVEAARAANAVAPKVAVPYHYNNFLTDNEALEFIPLLDDGIAGVMMNFKMY